MINTRCTVVVLLLSLCLGFFSSVVIGGDVPPNIIFIYTDDQRFDAFGAQGNDIIQTPCLDQLARRGVMFTQAAVVMSLCSPSRAAALTGRYGSANGVTHLEGALRPGERTFAHYLKEAGYQTAFVGKWHLKTRVPDAGFDFRCYFHGNGTYTRRKVWDNDHFVTPEGHVDAYCVKRSVAFLKEAVKSDAPFVLFHATQLPHMDHRHTWPSPESVRARYDDDQMPLPETWRGDLTGKPPYLAEVRNRTQADKYGYQSPDAIRRHVGDYYGAVTSMDANLKPLVDAMDELDLWRNTWCILMGDNGWLLGEHRLTSKVLPYAPSIRVPLLVVGPGLKPRKEDGIALNIDIAPTLLGLAGVPIPERMHGRSLLPLLKSRTASWRDHFIYECIGGYGGTRPLLAACSAGRKLIYTWDKPGDVLEGKKPAFVEYYRLDQDPNECCKQADSLDGQERKTFDTMAVSISTHIKDRLIHRENEPMAQVAKGAGKPAFSGIYPHLASFNQQNECGIGAVVPWVDRLWWITYAPHKPQGSDDKLYAINGDRDLFVWPGSVGGTPANRMIHRETRQLLIGPYVIDAKGQVRVIPPQVMPGRHTGIARHLTEPEKKVYYATMEEGFYEVDLATLSVKELFPDANGIGNSGGTLLPGYHGKGFYAGQGRVVYANNGERGRLAQERPDIESGVLASWTGKGDWRVVKRNQFTEVTGPGGIWGNDKPATDPIWSVGWDHRSLILMLLDQGQWHSYRLPKASHCYDGAHGWNTEWPRIRGIGQDQEGLLMTMHGMFWRFPRTFTARNSAGIAPRSSYLMVVGDFCRWRDHVVLGCDVTARSEFLNRRRAKGKLAAPGQSQSNLRFIRPSQLDGFGAPIGRGGVWVNDPVKADTPSEPFLFTGFRHRGVHLAHNNPGPLAFLFEVDEKGDNRWRPLLTVTVPPAGYQWLAFEEGAAGQWIRIRVDRDAKAVTAFFQYADDAPPNRGNARIFDGVAGAGCSAMSGGLLHAGGEGRRALRFAAERAGSGTVKKLGCYVLDADMKLKRIDSPKEYDWLQKNVAVPEGIVSVDAASVLYVDDDGRRYRLPKGDAAFDRPGPLGLERIDREVCTERDLFNCHGTFYELPARNAGGFSKIRPVATHNRRIKDYCSCRGLLVLSGVAAEAPSDNPHIIRSDDGKCALWVGAVDDLWRFGKPVGRGGPWKDTPVKAGKPSDPYLMTGYHKKTLRLSHGGKGVMTMRIEVDITGTADWHPYKTFQVPAGREVAHQFPEAFQAYWMRAVAAEDAVATVMLVYE